MPAQSFEGEIDGILVSVEAPEGAFPEGTTMQLSVVEVEQILDSVESALVDDAQNDETRRETAKIVRVKAVDITFYNGGGDVIEPACPISVVMKDALVAEADNFKVVHVDGKGNASVVSQDAEKETGEDEFAFSSDAFSTYAIVEIIVTTVITADGESYTVSLTYGPEAQLPEGSYLTAEEILPGSELFEQYYAEAEEVCLGCDLNKMRLFDLTILSPEGVEQEPKAPVQVKITLDEPMRVEAAQQLSVLHFAESKTEKITLLTNDAIPEAVPAAPADETAAPADETAAPADETAAPADETAAPAEDEGEREEAGGAADENTLICSTISFSADSFSRYAVVISGLRQNLSGESKQIAIVRQTNNTNWRTLQGVASGDSLAYAAATVEQRSTKLYANTTGTDITFWDFSPIEGQDGFYSIRVNGSDPAQYLHITSEGLSLSDTPQAIEVIPTSEGEYGAVYLRADGSYLSWSNAGWTVSASSSSNSQLLLCDMDLSAETDPLYSAVKYSVQDITELDQVVVYHSFYNPLSGHYELYVIDGEGKAVRAYDDGDRLTLHSAVSPLWQVVICKDSSDRPNGYYIFQNLETRLVLDPQEGNLVSEFESYETSGVTLDGRRLGDYNSPIEKWYADGMEYYGYKLVAEDGRVILESTPHQDSIPFSFAYVLPKTPGQLHEVATVDSQAAGIHIHMFDYGGAGTATNANNTGGVGERICDYEGAVPVWDENVPYITGLVSDTIGADGFPTFTQTGLSAATLFRPHNQFYKGTGNHLFLQSTYDSTGYYSYSGFNNFAHYNEGAGTFTVYEEIASAYSLNSATHYRGHFLPYNTIDPNRWTNGRTNRYDDRMVWLDYEDPNLGERIYRAGTGVRTGKEPVNYFFGMSMDCTFMMPRDGMQQDGPMLYEFTGDDDMWIYIDGVLILDLGGVHSAASGQINFATGQISANGSQLFAPTIRQCFQRAGVFPDGSPWDDTKADLYFKGETFLDFSRHDFLMLYMESGAGASNLQMRFNLPTVDTGKFIVEKELIGTQQEAFANVEFAYQAFEVPVDEDGNELEPQPLLSATYEGGAVPVPFYDSVRIPDDESGYVFTNVFYLKPGESCVFNLPETSKYYVQEVGVSQEFYDFVTINGVAGIPYNEEIHGWQSSTTTAQQRQRVVFANNCASGNLNNLRITKRITDDTVPNYNGDGFEFRVMMESANGELVAYSRGIYYIVNDDGQYCRYVKGKPVVYDDGQHAPGTVPYKYYAGQYGTISNVPANFTIVIPELLVGTDFYVDEIRVNQTLFSQSGWVLESKVWDHNETYDNAPSTLTGEIYNYETGGYDEGTADGAIIFNKDAHVTFTNRAENRIFAKKLWADRAAGNPYYPFVTEHAEVIIGLFAVNPEDPDNPLSLIDGTIRVIDAGVDGHAVLYAMFDNCGDLTRYAIREVKVQGGTRVEFNADVDGTLVHQIRIDGGTVVAIADENGRYTVPGEKTVFSDSTSNTYAATYTQGEITPRPLPTGSSLTTGYECNFFVTNTPYLLSVYKTDELDQPMAGAHFRLTDSEGNPVVLGSLDLSDLVTATGEGNVTDAGAIIFEGVNLPDGTYYLDETVVPAGYEQLAPIEITVGPSGTGAMMGVTNYDMTVTPSYVQGSPDPEHPGDTPPMIPVPPYTYSFTVVNNPGILLPRTGGAGTLGYTLGGIALLFSALAFTIYTRRRKNSET